MDSTSQSRDLYPLPLGLHAPPSHLLDLRPDQEVDHVLTHATPITSEKNIWCFWNTGYSTMHPYAQRNVRTWHRRFSKRGWTVRVVDRVPSSPLNIAALLDVDDPTNFPAAFRDGSLTGTYAAQHTSDLVRWPLLLKYGGVYADVGMIQIGDLDRLWNQTVGDPASGYEVLSYHGGDDLTWSLANYFLASRPNNALFTRCHKLLLELWAAEGGKKSTDGMHASPLLKGLPLMGGGFTIQEDDGSIIDAEETSRLLTDYIIQGQVITMVMGLVDPDDGWNGPEYVAKHVYAIEFMVGAQLINQFTAWNGRRAFDLMSLHLPGPGEAETDDQRQAREIVQACLQKSFGFKLAHGLILRVFKETLGSLWRQHEGSDAVPGTYAGWLRHATVYWNQDAVPPRQLFKDSEPFKRGPLLKEV